MAVKKSINRSLAHIDVAANTSVRIHEDFFNSHRDYHYLSQSEIATVRRRCDRLGFTEAFDPRPLTDKRTMRERTSAKFVGVAIVVLSLAMSFPISGTQVVAIRGIGWAVLAADSVITTPGAFPSMQCKIHQSGEVFWTNSGLDRDRATGFDIVSFFSSDAVLKGVMLVATLERIGESLVKPLQLELPVVRAESSYYLRKIVEGKVPIVSIYAARSDGNSVELYLKEFKVVDGRIVTSPARTCEPPAREKGLDRCLALTLPPELDQYIDDHPDIWLDTPVNAVDRLMGIAQAADPVAVGPPYSILEVRPDGARWLRQNDCEDVHSPIHAPHLF